MLNLYLKEHYYANVVKQKIVLQDNSLVLESERMLEKVHHIMHNIVGVNNCNIPS
jgi:hypothetical protein